jgi:hypothetical protein
MYAATDGHVYQDTADPASDAAAASAARDLPCDSASVVVVARDKFYTSTQEFNLVPTVVDGCGQRATYVVVHLQEEGDRAGRYVLVSRVPIPAARTSGHGTTPVSGSSLLRPPAPAR